MDEKDKGLRLSTLLDVLEPGTQININTDAETYTGYSDETPYYLAKFTVKRISIDANGTYVGLFIKI